MIAQVIVNSKTKHTDKKFDYLIPSELVEKVFVGTRVSIPFGQGNKRLEGYVVGVLENSTAKNLKSIYEAEQTPVFDGKMLEVIEWMREKYFCSYIDAIKIIVPAGTSIKSIEFAVLKNSDCRLGKKEIAVVDIVLEKGGACDVCDIVEQFED